MTPTFLVFCGKTTETNRYAAKTAGSGEELFPCTGTRRNGYDRNVVYMEGRAYGLFRGAF